MSKITNVYILDFGNRIKIGRTNNIEQRVKSIENASGEEVKEIFYVETDGAKEQILQEYLREYRTIGEYFNCPFETAKNALKNIADKPVENTQVNPQLKTPIKKCKKHDIIKCSGFVRKARHDLSLVEQKIMLYLMSKVKLRYTNFELQEFKVKDFCRVFEIDAISGSHYEILESAVTEIRNKNFYMESDSGLYVPKDWIEKPVINRAGIKIKLHDDLKPYLLKFKGSRVSYDLKYIVKMQSKYSIRIYELLKMYESIGKCELELDELKKMFGAEKQSFANFTQVVLDIAMREINNFTDVIASYELVKEGRKFKKIKFAIKSKLSVHEECTQMQINLIKAFYK